MVQLPKFTNEPAEMLSRLEDEFLGRSEDPKFSDHPTVNLGPVKVPMVVVVALAVALVAMLGVALYDGGFGNSNRAFAAFAVSFVAILVVGSLGTALRNKAKQARTGQLHLEIPRKTLALDNRLEGSVTLHARKPLEMCSICVGLALQVGQGQSREDTTWHYLCRSSVLLSSRSAFEAGARKRFDVRIATPRPEPIDRDQGKSVRSICGVHIAEYEGQGWWSIGGDKSSDRFLSTTKRMDQATLLKKRKLRWLITLELIGPSGILLQSRKWLKVDGGRRTSLPREWSGITVE